MEKITIAIVENTLVRGGGSERVLYDLIHGLDKKRFRPVLCCLYRPGELGEQLRAEGYRVYQNIVEMKYDPRNVLKIASILRREGADILCVTDAFHNVVVGRLAAFLARTPISVIMFHSFDQLIRKTAPRLRRLLLEFTDMLLLPHFHRAIALSETHKQYLTSVKRIPAPKIAVAYNGIDLGKFAHTGHAHQVRSSLQIPDGARVVGIVAGLRRWKAHDVFLAAAKAVVREAPDTFFVIAGDGPERSKLEKLARDLCLSDRVRFLGTVNDVPTLLQAIDLSVLSSVTEAFPLTMLESMAAALPVVATDVGGVSEIVEDGVNGFLAPPGAPDQLAQAMLRVLKDPELGRRLGAVGREKVEQQYTVERMVHRYESLFTECVSRGERPYATAAI
jgi:glycosyltransferase involved in cell wall biosynthesis